MIRIVWHHSAGPLAPTALDRRHYHRLVDGEGRVHAGDHPVEANAPGRRLVAGRYAAHTRNLNAGSIGLALCAMRGAVWSDPLACTDFPTAPQVDALIAETARLCRQWNIVPSRRTVLSHAEVEITLGVDQLGKWDLDYDPRGISPSRDPLVIGDRLRALVAAQLGDELPVALDEHDHPHPVLRRGATGEAVREVQLALRLRPDGIFGPATHAAVVAFQRSRQLLPDGIVGPASWASLFPSN